ncbi:MAG: hypothetical protein IK128_04170 [Clostridiales bacterium]|nr:hypothetical protein [Clostridiales bacterium]
MKRTKIISCLVVSAMVLGLAAGCSKAKKVTTDSVEKACEALDYEEYDIDDFKDGELEPSDIDDGVYFVFDADDIEDMEEENESVVSSLGLDDVLESDDIESAAIFMKGNGIEDFADDVDGLTDIEGVEDCEFDLVIGLQATLTDDDMVDDIMDYVEDMLDDYDLDVDDLSGKEYYRSKTEGYLQFNIDLEDFAKIALDNDDFTDLMEQTGSEDDIEDLLESITGNVCVSYQISGNNLIIVVGFSINSKPESLSDMCGKTGLSDPSKLKTNEVFAESIIESLVDNAMKYVSYASSASYDF